MRYIFLSPHLDDVVFSCGGFLWDLVKQDHQVDVWTFATRDPDLTSLSTYAKSLHVRWNQWENPSRTRREEDAKALALLGCDPLHLGYLDCIYRKNPSTGEALVNSDDDLFSDQLIKEETLIEEMTRDLRRRLPKGDYSLVLPLAVGNHVDHRNTRLTAEALGLTLLYYADFPYAAKYPSQVESALPENTEPIQFEFSINAINAWQNAVACYASQISSFWPSLDLMKTAITDYARQPYSRTLWRHFPA